MCLGITNLKLQLALTGANVLDLEIYLLLNSNIAIEKSGAGHSAKRRSKWLHHCLTELQSH